MLRSWDIDDSDGNRKQEMYSDPKGAAKKHLEMWRAKWAEIVAEMHRNNWQAEESRWYIQLVNEPDPAYVPQTVEYSLEAMRLVEGTPIRLGLVVSSVGTFSKPSENGDGWTKFIPLEEPINKGGHILVAHEYWQPEGPNYGEDGGNLAWRHRSIPLNVPILIGESGANGYIYQAHSQNDDAGWHKFMSPEQYAAQVKEYIAGCDKRVKGVLLYMLDYHSDQWESFYTGPAMEQLLAIKDTRPQVPSPFATSPDTTPPFQVHLPAISNGEPKPAYVAVTSGANVRSDSDGEVLFAVPYGDAIQVKGYNPDKSWAQVEYRGRVGWMNSSLFTFAQPPSKPVTQPEPTGNCWERAWPIVLDIEGGLSLDPGDPGNYYNGQLIGTKYGISAKSWAGQYDIPNLTKEQALDIYKDAYWYASGANNYAWPLCLYVFDTAVNHGVDVAKQLVTSRPTPEQVYLGQRALRYFHDPNWARYGVAWGNRVRMIEEEGSA
jgi:hypothetical protein